MSRYCWLNTHKLFSIRSSCLSTFRFPTCKCRSTKDLLLFEFKKMQEVMSHNRLGPSCCHTPYFHLITSSLSLSKGNHCWSSKPENATSLISSTSKDQQWLLKVMCPNFISIIIHDLFPITSCRPSHKTLNSPHTNVVAQDLFSKKCKYVRAIVIRKQHSSGKNWLQLLFMDWMAAPKSKYSKLPLGSACICVSRLGTSIIEMQKHAIQYHQLSL